jgi:amino acid transporter
VGYGLVFTVLSFAGFEGAATLGEETVHARRIIPLTLIGTVVVSGLFFMFVAYCEVVGFGLEAIRDLGKSEAPLNDLALRYGSRNLATALDLATSISCFSGVLGGLSAASRILFALGRAGLAPRLAEVHEVHGTPAVAITVATVMLMLPLLVWAPISGASNYYSYVDTIATLALILIYIAVGGAEMVEAWREQRQLWSASCVLGPIALAWALYCTIYPAPDYPNNLWPYVTLLWVAAALALIRLRPAVTAAPMPDYF